MKSTALDCATLVYPEDDVFYRNFVDMGFRVTDPDRAYATAPNGEKAPLGTASRVAMFPRNGSAIELIEIVDRSLELPGYCYLEQQFGLSFCKVQVRVTDLQKGFDEAKAAGLASMAFGPARFDFDGTAELQREASFLMTGGGVPAAQPQVFVGLAEHLTPHIDEVIARGPEYHDNRVQLVSATHVVVKEMASFLEDWRHALPWIELKGDGDRYEHEFQDGARIIVTTAENFEKELSVAPPDHLPIQASIGFGTSDLNRARSILDANGVPHKNVDGRAVVEIRGAVFFFEQI